MSQGIDDERARRIEGIALEELKTRQSEIISR